MRKCSGNHVTGSPAARTRKDTYPMSIVPHFGNSSYSLSPVYLLPAPPVRLMLPEPPRLKLLDAPKVAGLLPAHVPLRVVLEPLDLLDMYDDGSPTPFQTIEEADAEVMPYLERAARYISMARYLRAKWE